jgi:acetoin utilization deacetylase AcuC-like enzyme
MLDQRHNQGFIPIEPRMATLEELELIHTPAYIKKIMGTSGRDFTNLSPDTPASRETYLSAWLAVGGCLEGIKALMEGRVRACLALVRPPGHHALPDQAGGFCIFNNLGLTAKVAQGVFGLKRILIIDWDIHHGNGLQDIFYGEPGVLYFSTHFPDIYPYTGHWEEAGHGAGTGWTVNIPIPREIKDEELFHVYREVAGRMIRTLRPELILVAAGFDGHRLDPLGRGRLTRRIFGWLTRLIINLSLEEGRPPLLLALEGGYDTPALARSLAEVTEALLKQKRSRPGLAWRRRSRLPLTMTRLGRELIEKCLAVHRPYQIWTEPHLLEKP